MVSAPTVPFFTSRRRSVTEAVLICVAIAVLAARAIDVPASPLALVRIVLSVVAIAFVFLAPGRTLARRAIALIALDALCGTIAFAFVDAPFVVDHERQIGSAAHSIADRVDRIERAATSR